MAMSRRADRYAGIAIEKDVAVGIRDPHALRVIRDEFVVRAWVTRCNVLRVGFDDLAGFWSGELGLDTRSLKFRCRCHEFSLFWVKSARFIASGKYGSTGLSPHSERRWRELVAAKEVGTLARRTEFCDASRGHKN